jgi:predicted metalloprotease with PDZ domain
MTTIFNTVWTSPGRQFHTPIEMSYLAPYNDAAESIDETNFENTFISYYYYGEMLGLALDLSLREKGLNLDDFMKLMWKNYGKKQINYTLEDLHQTLNSYADKEFGDTYFNAYIYNSGMPDFKSLFDQVGVSFDVKYEIEFGATVRSQRIMSNPKIGSSAYKAGFQKGDKIIRIGMIFLKGTELFDSLLQNFTEGETIQIVYERFGVRKETFLTISSAISYAISAMNSDNLLMNKDTKQKRDNWLQPN